MSDISSKKSALEVMAGLDGGKDNADEAEKVDCPACHGEGKLSEQEADKVEECLNSDKDEEDGEGEKAEPFGKGGFSFKKKD